MDPQNLRVFEEIQQADLTLVESPLGKKHLAYEWLEDGDDAEYFLDTDGAFYAYEHGVPVHIADLSPEVVARLSGE